MRSYRPQWYLGSGIRFRQQPRQPQIGHLLHDRVLAQARPQVGEVDAVEGLVLIETGEDERFLARDRVDVALEALRADLFHHALHRRVDRADADVRVAEVRREDAVPRVFDGAHHAVGADGDEAIDVAQIDLRRVLRGGED